jgi:TATA-binding protein-associated factor Taf7
VCGLRQMEEQLVVQFPWTTGTSGVQTQLREAVIRDNGCDVDVEFVGEASSPNQVSRQMRLTVKGIGTWGGTLCDLPCIVESHRKRTNGGGFFKSSNISQMLVLKTCAPPAKVASSSLAITATKTNDIVTKTNDIVTKTNDIVTKTNDIVTNTNKTTPIPKDSETTTSSKPEGVADGVTASHVPMPRPRIYSAKRSGPKKKSSAIGGGSGDNGGTTTTKGVDVIVPEKYPDGLTPPTHGIRAGRYERLQVPNESEILDTLRLLEAISNQGTVEEFKLGYLNESYDVEDDEDEDDDENEAPDDWCVTHISGTMTTEVNVSNAVNVSSNGGGDSNSSGSGGGGDKHVIATGNDDRPDVDDKKEERVRVGVTPHKTGEPIRREDVEEEEEEEIVEMSGLVVSASSPITTLVSPHSQTLATIPAPLAVNEASAQNQLRKQEEEEEEVEEMQRRQKNQKQQKCKMLEASIAEEERRLSVCGNKILRMRIENALRLLRLELAQLNI